MRTDIDPIQLRFEAGVRAMQADDQTTAIAIFEELYAKTKAIRIKLEWAKAAYLNQDYALSKKLFQEVLQTPIPEAVRANVSNYLNEIDKLQSYTDYGFTFVRDTNPFAISKPQQITLLGLPFTFTPPQKKETLSGLRFYFSHSRALLNSNQLVFIGEADDTEYQGKDNNKSSIRLALKAKLQPKANWTLRTGIDHYFQRRNLLLRQPYVGYQYSKNLLTGLVNQYQIDIKVAKNIYPDFSDSNGYLRSLSVDASKNIDEKIQVGGSLYFDSTTAKARSQAYRTIAGNVFVRFFIPSIYNSSLQLSYGRVNRQYEGINELFILKRKDKKETFGTLIQTFDFDFFNLIPILEIGFEKSRSNIAINSFNQSFINLSFRKKF